VNIEVKVAHLLENSHVASEWHAYSLSHPEATFFHSLSWQKMLLRTFLYKGLCCIAIKNGKICGIFPLFLVRNLFSGHSLISAPLGVYGGICADDLESQNALLSFAKKLASDHQVLYLEIRNQVPFGEMPVKDLYVTFKREIFADEEKNFSAIPRKQRRMIRQGEKNNLSAKIGGEEFLEEFYNVYSQSVRNLGTPVYPMVLFRNLFSEVGKNCRILAVFQNSVMVAGVMTFFFRDQVLPYYGGALRSALKYCVNDYMYWKLLCFGASQGYKVFDFGRSKKETGAYHFKRHWGFEPMPLSYQYHLVQAEKIPDFSPRNPKFHLAIECWKRLPLSVTQWLGPKVVQFFP